MVWMFVSPQNSNIEILMPKVMIFIVGTLAGAYSLMNGINELWRRFQKDSLAHVRTQWEGAGYEPERGLSQEYNHAGTLNLDFQTPEL